LYVDFVGASPFTVVLSSGPFAVGAAARAAAHRKEKFYSSVSAAHQGRFLFLPFAFETLGGLHPQAQGFLAELRRLATEDAVGGTSHLPVFLDVSYAIAHGVGVCLASRLIVVLRPAYIDL
jgi:hypothetical protein